MKKKLIIFGVVYVVGIYVFQRYVVSLNVPGILDPLGSILGYPVTPAPSS